MTNKGYYKGTGSGAMGTHTKYGGYIIDWNKVRTYIVPKNLEDFKLTPFISNKVRKMKGRFAPGEGPVSGKAYLETWKRDNGES